MQNKEVSEDEGIKVRIFDPKWSKESSEEVNTAKVEDKNIPLILKELYSGEIAVLRIKKYIDDSEWESFICNNLYVLTHYKQVVLVSYKDFYAIKRMLSSAGY